ncbi:MAG TPA: aldehyde dehydrogenase family protein [Solirubrobacteraceae bacterium]|nr:aldehyde dehydrogenase family protein [Solirubrobacteraceae bacterium]
MAGDDRSAVTAGDPPAFGLHIGGEWRAGPRTFEDRNPARPAEVVGVFARADAADAAAACAAAAAAARGWRRTPAPQRGEILFRAAELLAQRAEATAEELTREEGKTLAEARGEVGRAVAILRYFAGETSRPVGSVYPSAKAGTFLYAIDEPLGPVLIITPWNFPIAIPAWKIAPALAYGNTVVWKPSELTPLCAARLVEALTEAGLPPGVMNLVTGYPAEIGDALTGDPRVAGISFTGSLAVGREIHAAVVRRGVKVQLELGGKNPVIVLPDADLDLAVDQTVRGAMLSTGQKCTATSRALLVGDVADEFTERLVERVRALRVGDPLDPGTDLGPLVSDAQRTRVAGYLDLARSEGHRLAAGGDLPERDGGHFVSPTVYLDVDPGSRIGQEEIFGPVVGTIRVRSLEEAIAVANDTRFGLSASLFTRDLGAAFDFAEEIEAGVVHVNSETPGAEPQAPFGGTKDSSSHSREQGDAARHFYTDTKTVYIDRPVAPDG